MNRVRDLVWPLVVVLLRLRRDIMKDSLAAEGGPVILSDSLACKYRQDKTELRVSCVVPRTKLGVLILISELAEAIDRGAFRAFARSPCGTKWLLAAMCLPFCKAGGHAPGLYALQSFMIWEHRELYRLFTSTFLHQDVSHLLSNLNALNHDGSFLEATSGAAVFTAATASLTASSSALSALYSRLSKRLGNKHDYYHMMGVGASGLAYGLQVVADYQRCAMGGLWHPVYIPLQYRCWPQLVHNQLEHPDCSFSGHLCGILAGLVRVFLPKAVKGLCSKAGSHQHARKGKEDALRHRHKLLLRHRTGPQKCPDISSLAWSDLGVHAVCAMICFCGDQGARIVYRLVLKRLSPKAKAVLSKQFNWQAFVHKVLLGGRGSRAQEIDKSSTILTSDKNARRRAIAAHNLRDARFL